MHLIVTGAAGFIGSHLSDRLLAEGHKVTGIDSFTPWYPRRLKAANLSACLEHPNFRLIEADIGDQSVRTLIASASAVIHLAAQPGVRGGWGSSFDKYLQANVVGTQRLLEHLISPGAAGRVKLVFASTSSVYGEIDREAVGEESPLRPISPYGVTKLTAEQLVRVYGRNHGLPWVILRYFTVYGPRQRPDMAFHRFIEAALTGSPVTLYGDGSQERDFTYVSDAVAATVAAATLPVRDVTLNVAGGSPRRLRTALDLLARWAGRTLKLKPQPLAAFEMQRTAGDIRAAGRLLGYQPAVSLEEGLRRHFDHLAAELGRSPVGRSST